MKKPFILLLSLLLLLVSAYGQLSNQDESSLPVRISTFNISKQGNEILLSWKVICRVSFARFEIQRSVNGKDFETIHQFEADKFRCQSPFDFKDFKAIGDTYYRISVGDIDGKFSSERIMYISAKSVEKTQVNVNNPAAGRTLKLSIAAKEQSTMELKLFNMLGKTIDIKSISVAAGFTSYSWNIPEIPAGIYFVKYSNALGEVSVIRVLKS